MPTQTELEFRATAGGQSQAERLRELFLARPGEWISMTDLGRAIGAWAVHSRVADCRRKFGMLIENKTELNRETGQRFSYYRYRVD
jgi:hypothetical protein